MEMFVTNTHIAPIVDVAMYEGPFSYDSLWSGDEDAEETEGGVVCWDYELKKLGERIVKEVNSIFADEKPLAKYGVAEIKATEFKSPREYNFMTDWLNLHVYVDKQFFTLAKQAILKKENRSTIVEHCREFWVSKDGFGSLMLDRVQKLSLDRWKHKTYGLHMATDQEIENALTADLCDVFDKLENEQDEDMYRDFGAVLALLWRIEYPGDFDQKVSESWSGSWVTDRVVDNLRCNSSLSEFCTVLDKDDLKTRFGEHMFDSETWLREFDKDGEKYLACEFADSDRTKKLWEEYRKLVLVAMGNVDREQRDIIRRYATSDKQRDAEINELLDGFREEKVKEYLGTEALGILWGKADRELSKKTGERDEV